jgi:hypothetical protein
MRLGQCALQGDAAGDLGSERMRRAERRGDGDGGPAGSTLPPGPPPKPPRRPRLIEATTAFSRFVPSMVIV